MSGLLPINNLLEMNRNKELKICLRANPCSKGHLKVKTHLSASFDTIAVNLSLDFSFQMSSGFSCDPSNICRHASTDFRIASRKISGKNFESAIRTFGPISLSVDILLRTSAERSRMMLSCALQKMWTRQTMPPVEEITNQT